MLHYFDITTRLTANYYYHPSFLRSIIPFHFLVVHRSFFFLSERSFSSVSISYTNRPNKSILYWHVPRRRLRLHRCFHHHPSLSLFDYIPCPLLVNSVVQQRGMRLSEGRRHLQAIRQTPLSGPGGHIETYYGSGSSPFMVTVMWSLSRQEM